VFVSLSMPISLSVNTSTTARNAAWWSCSSVGVDYFVVSRTMRRNARFRNRQYVLKLNSCRNTQTFAAAAADGVIAAAFDLATDCKANTVRDEPPPLNSTAPSDVSQSGDQV
jgi:hypothetical protein